MGVIVTPPIAYQLIKSNKTSLAVAALSKEQIMRQSHNRLLKI